MTPRALFLTLTTTFAIAPALTACAGDGKPSYETGVREPISLRDEGDECGASLVQNFIGLRANTTLREEIARRSEAKSVRWVEPGQAVTMDFRPDRMTATLDEDGVVQTMRCG